MIRYSKYAFFESEEDFKENTVIRSNINDFWFGGGLLDEKPKSFPVVYRYIEPWDTGCCGTWTEADPKELMKEIKAGIIHLTTLYNMITERLGDKE